MNLIIQNMEYPYLPNGREIKYVSIENIFMAEALKVRDFDSTDINHPTGAVVVKDNKIVGRGSNLSRISSKFLLKLHEKGLCVRRILKVRSGEKYWLCPGCALPENHAEYRAVCNAELNKKEINGADLYLYGHWWCCKSCWDKMIDVGIRDVYLVEGATGMFKDR